MRYYVISAMLLSLAALALRYASIGLLAYYWVSLMSVQQLMWSQSSIRFAFIIAMGVLIGYLVSSSDRRLSWSFPFTVCVLLGGWTTITTIFALDPAHSFEGLVEYLKILLMMLLMSGIVKSRSILHALCWVICISIGYYAIKYGGTTMVGSGIFVVRSGVISPIVSDTNQLARSFVFVIPIMTFLYIHSPWKSIRLIILSVACLAVIGLIGTNSRGGFVAFVAMLPFVWLQTKRKIATLLFGALALLAGQMALSEERLQFWTGRIHSIESYESDPSFQGRRVQWEYALELADARLTGGGFGSDLRAERHDGKSREARAYHSNYFQMLGDHGWPGLILYIILLISTWRLGNAIIKQAGEETDLLWARDLVAMVKSCMVAYMVGGLVITHAYYEPFYVLVALLTAARGIMERQISASDLPCVPAFAEGPSAPGAARAPAREEGA